MTTLTNAGIAMAEVQAKLEALDTDIVAAHKEIRRQLITLTVAIDSLVGGSQAAITAIIGHDDHKQKVE